MKEEVQVAGGHDEVVEVFILCPHCEAPYSHWINPEDWSIQGEDC